METRTNRGLISRFVLVSNLARSHVLSVYDAAYLELAMRRGIPLATLDDKLKADSLAVGVALYSTS